jgi:hopanoid biosynthesis associated radical SAM protein HpnH
MSIPLVQTYRIARYLLGKKIRGEKRYPLVLMLEPLFQCNLACAGCGKIDYPDDILKKRITVEQALNAVDECNAPMVSIPGGEPLIHKDMAQIVKGIIARKKFVYLCTNALLLEKKIDEYEPSPYLTFSIHLDGNRERHDASVCREGVYDKVIEVIKLVKSKGFRVNINCTLFQGESADEVADFFDSVTAMGIDGITMSPGFSYEHAPRQDVFLTRTKTKQLFRDIFKHQKDSRQKRWPITQSSLFIDFLSGNQTYHCTPWSNPTYNIFGWQKPCYLLVDEGYAPTFKALMAETEWDNYGTGSNPKCDNCMAHCGYEGTAINDTFARPWKAIKVALKGPRTTGPMAPELPIKYSQNLKPPGTVGSVSVDQLRKTASRDKQV